MPDPAHPGYARFRIRPQPGGGLTHAEATPRSPHGTIGSSWRDAGKGLVMQVTVPRGSTATIYVPATSADQVTASAGARPAQWADGYAAYTVAAGHYTFRVRG
ncbi:alpha-L-rhamnosidase C-terminal domain-containing protein [Streptomyces sp. NPDC088194]|uniref:alpha-L-rhamnosidase C-terminal domain-containing protein n=1 Tax=Streptomyces sp. NPDC088194 TaxID=3154931 RepID=UPI00345069AA